MPMYTELQKAVVLDCSAGDNVCSSYMEQILNQPATMKNDETESKRKFGPSKATKNYLEYRERMQSKLLDMNDNMSNLLRESFESIDNICNRVRSYLSTNECPPPVEVSSSYELQCVEAEETEIEGMSVIEELVEESSKTLTSTELVKTQAEELAEMKKIQFLNKQKEFTQVFKNSMKNIETFVVDMNKYVEDVNSRIDALKELPMWGANKPKANYKSLKHLKKQAVNIEEIEEISNKVLTDIDNLADANNITIGVNKAHIIPDVKSAKAVSNLHQRLVLQVEAKDSYACFKRLMKHSLERMIKDDQTRKNPIPPSKPKINSLLNTILKKGSDLTKMFDDSLWFSQKSFKPKNKARPKTAPTPSKENKKPSPKKKSKKQVKRKPNEEKKCNVIVSNESVAKPEPKMKVEWVHAKLKQSEGKTKKFRDILDEVSKADVMPLKSEYPRKDDLNIDPKKSFLFQVTNNSNVLQKLLTVNGKSTRPSKSARDVKSGSGDDGNDERMSKTQVVQKLKPYIFTDFSQRSVIVMPVSVTYNNPPTVKKMQKPQNKTKKTTVEQKQVQMLDMVKKLYTQQKQATPKTPPSFGPESPSKKRKIKVSKLPPITTSDEDSQMEKEKRTLGGKRRRMLDHLHGLKQKNDKFKGKIQEVIDVIECKMVDILSSPQTETVDAFDAMEKEITKVLQMMKTQKPEKNDKSDTSDISDELYRKLQGILDTPSTEKSPKSSERDLTTRIKDLSISSLNDSEQLNKLKELSNSIRVAHEHIQEICDEEMESLPSLHTKKVVTVDDGVSQKVVIFQRMNEEEPTKDEPEEDKAEVEESTTKAVEEEGDSTDNCGSTWLDDTFPDLDLTSIDSLDLKEEEDEGTSNASSVFYSEEEKIPSREAKFIENVMDIIQEVDEDSSISKKLDHQDFVDNMDEIFQKLELVYKKLDDGDKPNSEMGISELKECPLVPNEAMSKGDDKPEPNIYQLLETLTTIVEEGPSEIYTAREVFFTEVYHRPVIFEHVKLQSKVQYLPQPKSLTLKPLSYYKVKQDEMSQTKDPINYFYHKLLTQTIDYFKETVQDPKLTKSLETFLNQQLNPGDPPATFQQLTKLKDDIKQQQLIKQTDDFHAKCLKLFYALFYILMFVALNFHYICV